MMWVKSCSRSARAWAFIHRQAGQRCMTSSAFGRSSVIARRVSCAPQTWAGDHAGAALSGLKSRSRPHGGAMSAVTRRHYADQSGLDEIVFHKIADEVLEQLGDDFSDLVDEHVDGLDFEVLFSDGVLTLQLSDAHGTFVINKQTPNKQIWLSSPFSGPKRYDYDTTTQQWIYAHDDVALHDRLSEEISTALEQDYTFETPEIF